MPHRWGRQGWEAEVKGGGRWQRDVAREGPGRESEGRRRWRWMAEGCGMQEGEGGEAEMEGPGRERERRWRWMVEGGGRGGAREGDSM